MVNSRKHNGLLAAVLFLAGGAGGFVAGCSGDKTLPYPSTKMDAHGDSLGNFAPPDAAPTSDESSISEDAASLACPANGPMTEQCPCQDDNDCAPGLACTLLADATPVCLPDTGDCVVSDQICALPEECGNLSPCIQALCTGGQCCYKAINCDDANPCTTDSCDPALGCVSKPNPGLPCDDGDPATDNDHCDGEGHCGSAQNGCPQPTVCTPAHQKDAQGCLPVHAANGTACDDEDPATKGDQCDGHGLCTGTSFSCPAGTACIPSYTQNGTECVPTLAPDGTNCGGQKQCVGGNCQCTPNCAGKLCGSDGCGGSCGGCGATQECNGSQCVETLLGFNRYWCPSFGNTNPNSYPLPGSANHFYTSNPASVDMSLYTLEKENYFYMYSPGKAPAGTVPIYRYWNHVIGNHFYTHKSALGIENYQNEGVVGHVWLSDGPNRIPIYAYFSPDPAGTVYAAENGVNGFGDHFYSTEFKGNTIGAGPAAWNYGKIAWYSPTPSTPQPGDPQWPEVVDPEVIKSLAWAQSAFGSAGSLPVSFSYGGIHSSQLLPNWSFTSKRVRLVQEFATRTVTVKEPVTGLTMIIEVTERYDFASVEWVVRFEHAGNVSTAILDNILPLSASFGTAAPAPYSIHHALGSHQEITDFALKKTDIGPNGSFALSPYEGRSSDGALPLVNIDYPGNSGVVLGIGWSGQWAINMARAGTGAVDVNAGMALTHLRLHPGEKIRTPSIMLLFYNGPDYNRGQVFLRRLLRKYYSPQVNGVPATPPIAAAPSIAFESVNESNMLGMINQVAAHNLPVDTFWMDAGWFKLAGANQSWATSVGNFSPDPNRFPNGLAPIADAAHAAGLRYLLWFEPERVMPGTELYNAHPEWLIAPPNGMPPPIHYQFLEGFYLLDLGNDNARAWLIAKVSQMIGDIGVDIYRHDFNLYPLRYWRSLDAADRQGMAEIKYITGLYAYFDALTQAHPGLIIDNCASGGRRLDLETIRRSFALIRSDYLWDPSGQQNHTFGLSKWLPITGIGAADQSTYNIRSGYGTHFVLAQNYNALNPAQWAQANKTLTELQSIQHLYSGDFVTLTGTTNDDTACLAYQYVSQDASEGLVQVFRRPGCGTPAMAVGMVGLNPGATYALTDRDNGAVTLQSGAQLMGGGLSVTFTAQPQAKLYTYKKQ